jgi:hypothetical protein
MPDAIYRAADAIVKMGLGMLLFAVVMKLDRVIGLLEKMLWLQTNLLK